MQHAWNISIQHILELRSALIGIGVIVLHMHTHMYMYILYSTLHTKATHHCVGWLEG